MDFDCDDDAEFMKVLDEMDNQNDTDSIPLEPEPRTEHFECLQNVFGHSGFRPMQWKVIRSIIEEKRDNCCIMATGYGKSLCFQFPPVFTNGISLIVSPLISLMQDQVKSLNLVNIPACMLGSAQANKSIEDEIVNGDYRIVYSSPEYLSGWGSGLVGKLKDKLTLIAVDEAHCISSWGPDFRPKFLELKNIRNAAPNVPILAVTATATDQVQKDICSILKLRNPQVISTGFDRPNLEILVRPKTKDAWNDIKYILRSKLLAEASCIIYCLTRKYTDSICDDLKREGIKCGAYHAGKTMNQRKEIFDKFVKDEINVIVATVAFGMGIDKSDVRCVIHYGTPADMDSYYQEIGRAGRDGVQSKCILFHSPGDFEVHRHLRMVSNLSDAQVRRAEDRATVMKDFIYTKQCRRLKILQYFDGPTATCPKIPVCCDNCRLAATSSNTQNVCINDKEIDFSKDAKILLNAIDLFGGSTGITKPIAVLRGSKLKTVERYHNHKLMGSGVHQSEHYWKIFADLLERNGLLERQHAKHGTFKYSTTNLTRQARDWLVSGRPFACVPSEQLFQMMTSEKNAPNPSSTKPLYDTQLASNGTLSANQITKVEYKPKGNDELKRSLLVVRAMIASREGTMPYKIASEPAIDRLVQIQPLNLQELRDAKVDGFSDALVNQFGPEFLKCIQRSKGLLPQTSSENMVQPNTSTTKPSTVNSSDQHESPAPQSANQSMFDDDDDLFLNIEIDGEKIVQNPSATKSVPQTKTARVTTTFSKRVKYENSSSDEDPTSSESKPVDCPQRDAHNPPKPIGIRKRKIF
ncbi:Werner syndrome ATP-dependent helicase-like isoform X1 [Bradysia coprophila]|uniref:Werner syndrome ATP-dependent helicase-like isoform X1 n=1 Tax=Bradysia coprophila TaxID=38358 RepID=UPI00187D70F4|nr:Werner syndrome ATP-dependent helicase-like isoform X1 [Bradysia coprophila]